MLTQMFPSVDEMKRARHVLRKLDDPPIVRPLVQVGEGHFVARHRVGGLY